MKILEFGEPLLRKKASAVKPASIKSKEIAKLIKEMGEFLAAKKLGVGLAAPQIGSSLSIAIIAIQPTAKRPNAKKFNLTIINPKIKKAYGYRKQLWEGCISGGPSKSSLFALVPRYRKIDLEYYDENGKLKSQAYSGLAAQVIQHEIDHLNGILFVDRVKNTKSYITYSQYLKMNKPKAEKRNGQKA